MTLCRHTNTAALILSGLLLLSCQQTQPKKEPFSGNCIADPITYEVIVNNPNPEDDWKTECLANTSTKNLVADIVEAVKDGKLKAFDYYDNHLLTREELNHLFEEEKIQEKIGNIQFIERWYWNKENLQLQKKVEKLMLGYELYDLDGKVKGYKASFTVKLGD
jgi:hypothetical protein